MPATGSGGSHSFIRPDRPRPTGPEPEGYYREVSPGYFRTLGIPLLGGRDFGPEDARGSAPVVIVNRAVQERYFPGEDAIGKTIRPISATSGLVLRGSSPPIVAGALAGLAGSVALATVFRGLLFGVASADPAVLAAVAGVLGIVAVGSALFPALRAARVDPAKALRSL